MLAYVVPASIAVGVLLLIALVRWAVRRRVASEFLLELTHRTKILLLLLPALFLGARALALPADVARLLRAGAGVAFIAQVALWVAGIADFWLRRYHRTRLAADPAAAMTVNIFRVSAVAAVWIVATIVAIDNLGFNVTTLIAGLGIGGVAVALALQNILGDLFASLSIVVDKPFVLGDAISVDKDKGVVEHIGLKTTRLRATGGEELIFSNGDLLKSRIRNFRRMGERRAQLRLVVDGGTAAETLARIPLLLRGAVEKQPDARFERAHLVRMSEEGFAFETVFAVASGDYGRFLDVQQAVLLEIARAFEEAKVRLAASAPRNAMC